MTFHERVDCRLCGGALERVLDLGETPLANALLSHKPPYGMHIDEFTAPLYLSRCLTCGHCQLPVVVDPKLLFPADYPYASATGASMREHLDKVANELLPQTGELRPMVVEIGSNDGYLLRQFWRNGCRVVGVDPAGKPTDGAVLTVPTFFDTIAALAIKTACGKADLIVANNVFAHADNLHEIVEGVKVLLAPEGRFVFEVGYLPDVLRANNWPVVYHEHLSYHHLTPLVMFFQRHGLEYIDAQRVNTQGGSIRCTFGRVGSGKVMPLCLEEGGSPPISWMLKGSWQSRVDSSARAFASTLRSLKSQGKSIAGYGCSAKSTTLLHVADIGREQISFICDDAPTKQGKFSPGKHIPIVPGSWLEEKQPDYCVSLSGNFSEAFKAEHPGFKGEWLEPQLT